MKKFLKIVGVILLLCIAFVLIAGIFVKKDYHFQKDIVVNASKDKVWSNINSLRAMDRWSPWTSRDANIRISYEGEDGAIGSKQRWEGNREVGSGEMTLKALQPQEGNNISIHFIKPWEGDAESYVKLADQGAATKVTWGFDSKSPYPMNVMHLFMDMDAMMDKDFGTGLTKLKSLSEAN